MKIEIKGAIVSNDDAWIYEYFEMECTTPKMVNQALEKAKGEDIEVVINSGGGSVFAGSEIYTALKSYNGKTEGKIVGVAASAASVIAMGVKFLQISPAAHIMTHRASTYGEGNKNDMQKTVGMLDGIDQSIANVYLIKTGMSQQELLSMMDKETWLTAQQAKELGFVDAIMFEDEVQAVASADVGGLLPQSVINKIRNEFRKEPEAKDKEEKAKQEELEVAKAKLKLALV
ncbi:MAG: Clp protease ClpP [Lachnospiraceae bacterium]|nr:Clp protease ClpP [Lachnospiraceae bacterium]